MTDHKPFTAEQLDELDKLGPGELLTSELERLIAQAREEIRLRENAPVIAEIKELRFAYIRGEKLWRELLACVDRLVEPTEAPAARAKRELGEWLAANQGWTFATEENDRCTSESERWICMIHASAKMVCRWGTTEHEAITAALREAKEKP